MDTRLSPLDAAFLELEQADESAHMHIGWAMVFEPLPDGGRPELGPLKEQTRERLTAFPRFTHRLSSPRVGSLSLPSWVPDPDFEVDDVMRRATLPEPGGEPELMDWLGDFYSHRLDRSRPLWETTLLEGLEGDRWALVTKAHHCLIDGISGAGVAAILLDAEREPDEGSVKLAELVAEAEEAEEDESGRGALARLRGVAASGIGTATHPRKALDALAQSRALAEGLVRDEVVAAPHTSLNGSIGASRRMAAVDVSLSDLKRVKDELGGTVNDVMLAASAGGLRRLFEHRDELPEVDHVRAMVPVSVRRAGESLALGNKVSSLFVDLLVSEPDPVLRYRKIAQAAEQLKSGNALAGTDAVIKLAGLAPPLVQSVVARLSFTPRLFNLTITNVPASPVPLYALGARLERVVPLVPIFTGHAVGIAVVSYDGKVTFGLNADRASVPELDVLREGIASSIAELAMAAR